MSLPNTQSHFDTIVGISTPIGVGAIGIVRLSGVKAKAIAVSFCQSLTSLKPRYVSHVSLLHNNKTIDDACVVYFEAPHSYTGEDCVEFQCHSNPLILNQLVDACIQQGARLAEPGEFTKRAVVHGKMDVMKAESVIDIIHASSDLSKQVSLNRLNGKLYAKITEFRANLMRLVEQIEGAIDFPEEVPELEPSVVLKTLRHVQKECQQILRMQDFGKVVYQGVNVVIIGKPNAGKSSLLNYLVGENRAIVTAIPGTTRDYIECQVSLGGGLFNVIDTAGIRQVTDDTIEKQGIRKIKGLIKKADVIIVALDGTKSVSVSQLPEWTHIPASKKQVVVLTKSDLAKAKNNVEKQRRQINQIAPGADIIQLSSKTGTGMNLLKQRLVDTFLTPNHEVDMEFLCNIRQITCLKEALKGLETSRQAIQKGYEQDLVSFELKQVVEKLGELSGDALTEEMLDGIFSRFCVGK